MAEAVVVEITTQQKLVEAAAVELALEDTQAMVLPQQQAELI